MRTKTSSGRSRSRRRPTTTTTRGRSGSKKENSSPRTHSSCWWTRTRKPQGQLATARRALISPDAIHSYQFSRGSKFRAKLNTQQLAKLVISWPWRNYVRCLKVQIAQTGYYVLLFMREWDGERLRVLTRLDACELRKRFLIHLLT
nr:uncharacterized protein LOC117839830 isoform X2 [Setaria viridis]